MGPKLCWVLTFVGGVRGDVLAQQMIRETRNMVPVAAGQLDPIVARIDRATQAELRSCAAWAQVERVMNGNEALRACPLRAFYSSVALDNLRGDKNRAKFGGRVFKPPRGWGLPKDAVHLCAFLTGLSHAGTLPPNASAVRAAGLVLIDVGSAYGGETVVGGELGFEVVAFEPHPAEWARLQSAWGRRSRTRIVNAAVTRASSNVTLLAAEDSSSLEPRAMREFASQIKANREQVARIAVRGVNIDAELRRVSGVDPRRVAVIKLDIQGHEYEALAGAVATLRAVRPVLYFEYLPSFFKGDHAADVNKVLCLAMLLGGYRCTRPSGRGELANCVPVLDGAPGSPL